MASEEAAGLLDASTQKKSHLLPKRARHVDVVRIGSQPFNVRRRHPFET